MRHWWMVSGPGILALASLGHAQGTDVAMGSEPDVVVVGIPPRCRSLAGDPQDAVDLHGASANAAQTIRIEKANGRYVLVEDDFPTTGPEIWQRAGKRLDNFIFRARPTSRTACIGMNKGATSGVAQLRRQFAARPTWGSYVMLSTRIATRKAGRVDVWIAAGANHDWQGQAPDHRLTVMGGGFKQVPLTGDYRWQEANFLIGPIPCSAAAISYGIQLQGGGDVWLSDPHFIIVPERSLSPSMRQISHGQAMLASNPICRHFLKGVPLWRRSDRGYSPASDNDILAHAVLYTREGETFRIVTDAELRSPGVTEF